MIHRRSETAREQPASTHMSKQPDGLVGCAGLAAAAAASAAPRDPLVKGLSQATSCRHVDRPALAHAALLQDAPRSSRQPCACGPTPHARHYHSRSIQWRAWSHRALLHQSRLTAGVRRRGDVAPPASDRSRPLAMPSRAAAPATCLFPRCSISSSSPDD